MILAVGLSPAWQQTLRFDALRLGEVNRAREAHWCASGKVVNAARAAQRLASHGPPGLRARALTVLGGATGDAAAAALAAEGLEVAAVRVQAATRVCTSLVNRADGSVTELVENAGPLAEAELAEFAALVRREIRDAEAVILSGSLPAGAPAACFRTLAEGVAAPLVIDARGPELLETLPLRPFLVKPNREELAGTLGRPLEGDAPLRDAMRELARRGARWVLVSQGREAAWLLGEDRFYRIHPPAVETVNPIGSGDCLAAGIAAGLGRGLALLDAVRLGIAAAAENAATLLPGHIHPAAVERRRAAVRIEGA